MTLDSTPPEGTDRPSLEFDDEDTSVLATMDPKDLDREQRARVRKFKRQQAVIERVIVGVVEVNVKKFGRWGWKVAAAFMGIIVIEAVRTLLDWLVHR